MTLSVNHSVVSQGVKKGSQIGIRSPKMPEMPNTHYSKYKGSERIKLWDSIQKEWDKLKFEVDTQDEFLAHLIEVLHKKGFKAPNGMPLTERGVRYQLYRMGIRFRGKARRAETLHNANNAKNEPAPPTEKPIKASPTPPASANTDMAKLILESKSFSDEQKLELVSKLMGLK